MRLIERHARRPSAAGRRVRRGRERRSFHESVKQDRQQKDERAYSGVLEMAAQTGRAACDPEQGRHLARLSILGGCRAGSRSEGSEVVGSQRENSLTVLTPGCWRCVRGNRPASPCGEDSTRREAARSYRELNSSWRAGGVKPGLEGRYGRRFSVLFQPGNRLAGVLRAVVLPRCPESTPTENSRGRHHASHSRAYVLLEARPSSPSLI